MALTKVSSKTLSDNAVTADKIATGAITITDIPDGEITAAKLHTTAVTDKLGYTPVAPGDSPSFAGLTVDTNTLYVDSTNNLVGVGTNSPNDITGTGLRQLVVGNNSGNNGVIVNSSSSGDSAYSFAVNNVKLARIGYDYLNNMTFQTNNAEKMRITSSGLVGIGTSSPSQELHVYGNNADGARIRLESTDYYTSLDMVAADGTSNVINFGDASDVNVGRIEYDHSANAMFIKTNDAERMRIDSSGNVGIGRTTGIGYRISLLGNTQATSSIQMTYTGVASATMGITSGGDVAFGLDNTSGTTERMRITSSGRVGIGTSSPVAKFDLVDGNSKFLMYENVGNAELKIISNTGADGALYFGDLVDNVRVGIKLDTSANALVFAGYNNAERMRIDSSGNVGINASSPGNKLYISGGGNQHSSTGWATVAAIRAHGGWLGGLALTGGNLSGNTFGYNFYGLSNSNPNGGTLHIRGGLVGSATANGVYLSDVTATSWSSASDERQKQNLESIENALDKVSTLRTVTGEYIHSPGIKHPFLIAQDVQAVLPEAVSIAEPDTEEQYLGLSYTDVIPLLTAALKEAKAEIDDLKARMQALENN